MKETMSAEKIRKKIRGEDTKAKKMTETKSKSSAKKSMSKKSGCMCGH